MKVGFSINDTEDCIQTVQKIRSLFQIFPKNTKLASLN